MSAPAPEVTPHSGDTTPTTFDLSARLETAPEAPGVYIMRDRAGTIVYVGKAVNLRARLRAYANQTDTRSFVRRLPYVLSGIETIITPSEQDALQLECELINEHLPRYNVRIPGEGSEAYLRLHRGEFAPWVEVVKEPRSDGASYFGPYRSRFAVSRLKEVLDRHFLLRTCDDRTLRGRSRPCLQYQIKRCAAPCVFSMEEIGYAALVENAADFLSGRRAVLRERLEARMYDASERLEFELAAHYRDHVAAIDLAEAKREGPSHTVDMDVFGHYREGDALCIQVLFSRRGRLKGSRYFVFEDQPFPDEEVYSTLLNLYYQSGAYVPHEVVVPVELEGASALEGMLSGLRSSRVQLKRPQRGKKAVLLETAHRNAEVSFREQVAGDRHRVNLLSKLQKRLDLANFPARIECFDISNFQGAPMVGAMSVFVDGEPSSKDYRTWKIKNVAEQNDFACMYEVLTRRLKRALSGEWPAPDLIVVDGGKGQLNQAVTVLEELQIDGIDVIGLAKSRAQTPDGAEVTEHSPERVFLPGRKNPVVLNQNSAELFLLQRLRDEAHRKAITFHRSKRREKTLKSRLSEIPGVGPKRQRALLVHFGSLDAIKKATVEELAGVKGLNEAVARKVRAFFDGGKAASA